MRNPALVLLGLFLGLVLVLQPGPVAAQTGGEVEAAATASAMAAPEINYSLPYPGILPDSPLYFLKQLRDKVMGLFIFDPLSRAHYDLMLSDKQLAAGQMLIDYGKADLGKATVLTAEQKLLSTVSESEKLAPDKEENSVFLGKLSLAAAKHQEVVGNLSAKTGDMTDADSLVTEANNRVKKLFEKKLQNLPSRP